MLKASARRACPRTLTIARTPLNCWSPCLRRHKSTVAPSKSALRSEPASRAALRTLPAGAIVRSRKLQLFALPCRPGGRVATAFVVLARSVQPFCAHACVCLHMPLGQRNPCAETKGCVLGRKIPPIRPMGWAEFRSYPAPPGSSTKFSGSCSPVQGGDPSSSSRTQAEVRSRLWCNRAQWRVCVADAR